MSDFDSIFSDSDVPELDNIMDDEQFKQDLRACLDDTQHEGTFSAFHVYTNYVNPGLYISNYGSVGLPLAARDAQAIAGICKQSPFGKGAETIIDTSVRKTWELDYGDFECRNPAWNGFLDSLVKQTVEDLGVQVKACAERYKLLLYEEGAFFKAHKDSEKVPGMFGTLVVCLPSEHGGGEVILVHGQEKRVLVTEASSQHDFSTLAWYSDVQHEVRPVTSGYRLVLTFNLVQDQHQPRQTAFALDENHARFTRLLQRWKRDFHHLDKLVYPLEHQYTEASLSLTNLKGQDAAKGRYLQHICSKNEVYWFLARLTKETEDDYDREEQELSLLLDYVVTPDGSTIDLDLDVTAEDILIEEIYDERSADSEDEGEFTGNEGTLNTYRYHNTVCVLLRKDRLLQCLPTGHRRNYGSLSAVLQLVRNDQARESLETSIATLRSILHEILQGVLGKQRNYHASLYLPYPAPRQDAYSTLFFEASRICRDIGNESLPREVLQYTMKDEMWSSLDFIRLVARQAATDITGGISNAWDLWFSQQTTSTTFNKLNKQRSALNSIKAEIPPAIVDDFDDWRAKHFMQMLRQVDGFKEVEDVTALLDIIPSIGPEYYLEVILPNILRRVQSGMIIQYLAFLAHQRQDDAETWNAVVKTTYEKSIQTHVTIFKLPVDDLGRFPQTPPEHYFAYHIQNLSSDYPSCLLSVLGCTMTLGLETEALQLIEMVLPELPPANDPFWIHFNRIMSFIEQLAAVLVHHRMDSVNAKASPFVIEVLEKVKESTVYRRPTEPKDWRRVAKSSCNCSPCGLLNRFLGDRNQSVGRFAYAKKVRDHLQYALHHADYRFETEKVRSPHTLIIRKTNNEYIRLLREWTTDANTLGSQLRRLHGDAMKILLGQNYDRLLHTDLIIARELVPGQRPLQAVSASVQNYRVPPQVNGLKRKAGDVIDLTGDASD